MKNPLTDALTPEVRRALYALLFLVSTAFSVWQVSDGNWGEFVGGLLAALLGLLAGSNVETPTRRRRRD